MDRFNGSIGGVAMASGAAASSAAALGGALKSAFDASRLEQELIRTNTALGGTKEGMAAITDKAFKSAMESQFTPEESVQALKNLAELGFSTSEAMDALDDSLRLAAVGGFSLEKMSALMGSSLKLFSADASEATAVANEMGKAAAMSGINLGDMQMALASMGASGTSAGFSREDQLSLLGLSKNVNARAQTSGRQAKLLMEAVAKEKDAIHALGVATLKDNGQVRDIQSIVLDVVNAVQMRSEDSLDAMAQLNTIFGAGNRTAAGIAAQLNKGIEGVDGIVRFGHEAIRQRNLEIQDSGGFLKGAVDELLNTFAGEVDLIKGVVMALISDLGLSVAHVLKPFLTTLRHGIRDVTEFVREMSPQSKKILAMTVVGVTAVTALITTVGAVAATIGFVAPMITAGLGALASAAPFIAVTAAAAGALGLAFVGLRKAYDKNIGGFGDFVSDKMRKAFLLVSGLVEMITTGKITGDTAKGLRDPQNASVLRFLDLVAKYAIRARVFVRAFVERFNQQVSTLAPKFERLKTVIDRILTSFDDFFSARKRALGSQTDAGVDGIDAADGAIRLLGRAVDIASSYFETWEGFISKLGDTIKEIDFDQIGKDIDRLGQNMGELTDLIFGKDAADAERSGLYTVGRLLGTPLSMALKGVTTAIGFITWGVANMMGALSVFGTFIMEDIPNFFKSMGDTIKETFDSVMNYIDVLIARSKIKVAELIGRIPSELMPKWAEDFISETDLREARFIVRQDADKRREEEERRDSFSMMNVPMIKAYRDSQDVLEASGAVEGSVTDGATMLADAVRKGFENALKTTTKEKRGDARQPVVVKSEVKINDLVLGEAMANVSRQAQSLFFGGDLIDEDD
jgi:TP901 family phage tail tape measure protein